VITEEEGKRRLQKL